jgi:hypothetical protein
MSEQPPVRPRALSPGMMVLLIGVGIILLLPGLCATGAVYLTWAVDPSGIDAGLIAIWVAGIAVSAGGVMLIRYAVRRDPA